MTSSISLSKINLLLVNEASNSFLEILSPVSLLKILVVKILVHSRFVSLYQQLFAVVRVEEYYDN
jgi:hypothetical protein